MANRPPVEIVTGIPTPPFSATDSPPPSKLYSFLHKPILYVFLTWIVISFTLTLFLTFPCHVSFSIESISGSSSSSSDTWHVNFVVKNKRSLCPNKYYNYNDVVYAKLGYLNAAVLKTSRTRGSLSQYLTSFSVDLATEGNQTDVIVASPRVFELDMKLSAKLKDPGEESFGHFDIKCQNLTLGYLNIKCHSSFKYSETVEC